jgi:hypothetical protein
LHAVSCSTDDVTFEDDGTPDARHAIPDVAFAEYLQFRGVGNVQAGDAGFTLGAKAAAAVRGTLDLRKSAARITELEAANVPSAAVKIVELDGIQYFVNVDTLLLVSNELLTLDVSALARLAYLDINANFLTALDLSNNPELTYLRFGGSTKVTEHLTTIDLSANTKLEYLDLNRHDLTTIDLSANTALKEVNLANNPGVPFTIPAAIYDQLTTKEGVRSDADVPPASVTYEITDVAFAEYLQYLAAGNVQLVDGKYMLDVTAAGEVTGELDLRKSAARITVLENANVPSAATKIKNLDGIQHFVNIDSLLLVSNELATLDISALTRLSFLDINANFISSLDLSANTGLKYLRFGASTKAPTLLTTINLSANTRLEYLDLNKHGLATIDLSANTALKDVNLSGNPGAPFTIPAAIYDQLTTKNGVQK